MASASTTRLVQKFLREEFHADYSRPSCRRLMKSAGLSYRPPIDDIRSPDGDDETAMTEEDEKAARQRHGWLPT